MSRPTVIAEKLRTAIEKWAPILQSVFSNDFAGRRFPLEKSVTLDYKTRELYYKADAKYEKEPIGISLVYNDQSEKFMIDCDEFKTKFNVYRSTTAIENLITIAPELFEDNPIVSAAAVAAAAAAVPGKVTGRRNTRMVEPKLKLTDVTPPKVIKDNELFTLMQTVAVELIAAAADENVPHTIKRIEDYDEAKDLINSVRTYQSVDGRKASHIKNGKAWLEAESDTYLYGQGDKNEAQVLWRCTGRYSEDGKIQVPPPESLREAMFSISVGAGASATIGLFILEVRDTNLVISELHKTRDKISADPEGGIAKIVLQFTDKIMLGVKDITNSIISVGWSEKSKKDVARKVIAHYASVGWMHDVSDKKKSSFSRIRPRNRAESDAAAAAPAQDDVSDVFDDDGDVSSDDGDSPAAAAAPAQDDVGDGDVSDVGDGDVSDVVNGDDDGSDDSDSTKRMFSVIYTTEADFWLAEITDFPEDEKKANFRFFYRTAKYTYKLSDVENILAMKGYWRTMFKIETGHRMVEHSARLNTLRIPSLYDGANGTLTLDDHIYNTIVEHRSLTVNNRSPGVINRIGKRHLGTVEDEYDIALKKDIKCGSCSFVIVKGSSSPMQQLIEHTNAEHRHLVQSRPANFDETRFYTRKCACEEWILFSNQANSGKHVVESHTSFPRNCSEYKAPFDSTIKEIPGILTGTFTYDHWRGHATDPKKKKERIDEYIRARFNDDTKRKTYLVVNKGWKISKPEKKGNPPKPVIVDTNVCYYLSRMATDGKKDGQEADDGALALKKQLARKAIAIVKKQDVEEVPNYRKKGVMADSNVIAADVILNEKRIFIVSRHEGSTGKVGVYYYPESEDAPTELPEKMLYHEGAHFQMLEQVSDDDAGGEDDPNDPSGWSSDADVDITEDEDPSKPFECPEPAKKTRYRPNWWSQKEGIIPPANDKKRPGAPKDLDPPKQSNDIFSSSKSRPKEIKQGITKSEKTQRFAYKLFCEILNRLRVFECTEVDIEEEDDEGVAKNKIKPLENYHILYQSEGFCRFRQKLENYSYSELKIRFTKKGGDWKKIFPRLPADLWNTLPHDKLVKDHFFAEYTKSGITAKNYYNVNHNASLVTDESESVSEQEQEEPEEDNEDTEGTQYDEE